MLGCIIHTYRIEELLGEGGMGTVYRAVDTVLGRDVAIKALHPALLRQSAFLERFRSEARVLARLNHPNIAVLHNFIEAGDDLFMVMEYVEGLTLEALLRRRGKLRPEEAVPLIRQALEGLQHAHRRGILHRDLKPANLMLTPEGLVKVMDFGIAKVAGAQRLTQANHLVGTLEYLAPEQVRGEEPSPASDLYAIGVLLYELLTGRVPFAGTSDYALMERILRDKPTAPIRVVPNLPKGLSEVLSRTLAKTPADRYTDAPALGRALAAVVPATHVDFGALTSLPAATEGAMAVPSSTPPPTRQEGVPPQSRQWMRWLGVPFRRDYRVLTGCVLLAATLLLGSIWLTPPVPTPAGPASPAASQTAQLVPETSTPSVRTDGVAARDEKATEGVPVQPRSDPAPGETPLTTPRFEERRRPREKESPASPTNPPKQRTGERPTPAQPEPTPATPTEPAEKTPVPAEVTEKPTPTVSRPTRSVAVGSRLVVVELLETISSEQPGLVGRRLRFRTVQPVVVDGATVIRAGADATGEVTDVKEAGVMRRPRLEFRIRSVEGVDGRAIPLRAATFREVSSSADAVVRFRAGQLFEVRTESGAVVQP